MLAIYLKPITTQKSPPASAEGGQVQRVLAIDNFEL